MPGSNSDAQLRAVVAIARIAIEGDTDEPAERVPPSTHLTPISGHSLPSSRSSSKQASAEHNEVPITAIGSLLVPIRADVSCVGGAYAVPAGAPQ